jgi:hypothetical protein
LSRLERDLARAKERLADGPEGSRVFADPYADPPRALGADTHIEFRLGESWADKVTVQIDGTGVRVMGGSSLVVKPMASNVIHVEPSERW